MLGRKRVYRFMCTATSRLLQAVRSCTHTSVPSLVNGIFEMSQKNSFLGENKISLLSFSFGFLFPKVRFLVMS